MLYGISESLKNQFERENQEPPSKKNGYPNNFKSPTLIESQLIFEKLSVSASTESRLQ